ncbi:MAG: hypothetical protein ACLQBC_13505 [Syntrophales bacterium]
MRKIGIFVGKRGFVGEQSIGTSLLHVKEKAARPVEAGLNRISGGHARRRPETD